MTVADITLAAFTLCNSARVVAYVPQIAKAATDENSAQAISFTTSGLFLFSNTSAYACVNNVMFAGNAIGCTAILLIGTWKLATAPASMGPRPSSAHIPMMLQPEGAAPRRAVERPEDRAAVSLMDAIGAAPVR